VKNIKLVVSKNGYCNISPLVDENNEPLNLNDLALSVDLEDYLWDWQNEFTDSNYDSWTNKKKFDFEKDALYLVEQLLLQLPRNVQFSYYSELFRTEIEF